MKWRTPFQEPEGKNALHRSGGLDEKEGNVLTWPLPCLKAHVFAQVFRGCNFFAAFGRIKGPLLRNSREVLSGLNNG